MPILWHIMKIYKYHGIREFVLCLGQNGEAIKEFFMNLTWSKHDFRLHRGDVHFFTPPEEWDIIFAETGKETMTGGRIKRIEKYITEDEFMLTYGDGVSDVDLNQLLTYHWQRGKIATVTGVRRPTGFGLMQAKGGLVTDFQEKPLLDGWTNGGYFVLRRSVFSYIDGDNTVWEAEPINKLVQDQELALFPHTGFWQCVDTAKDLEGLNSLWRKGKRPWAKWEEKDGGTKE